MNLLKRTSTKLWQHQTNPAMPPSPAQRQFAESMGVTFREPTKISGTVLLPGRYVFRRQDCGTHRNVVQIFREDSTELVATLTAMPDP